MKYPKKFREVISNCAEEMRLNLFHGEYFMNILYDEEDITKGDCITSATMWTDPVYLNCDLTIHPPVLKMYKEKKFDKIIRTLIHEMCHLLTEPLYRFSNAYISEVESGHLEKIRERQTQRIANVAYMALNIDKYIKILKG